MSKIRKLQRHGNKPVFAYRDEILKPFSPNWDSDDPYSEMPENGSPLLLLNTVTGQEVGLYVWEDYKAPARLDWADVARRFFGHVAKSGDYSQGESRLLMHIFSEIGFGNAAVFTGTQLADSIGMGRAYALKLLSDLVSKGAVVKVQLAKVIGGKSCAYRLNANLGVVAGERLGSRQMYADESEREIAEAS